MAPENDSAFASSAQDNVPSHQDDAELIAHYEAQRTMARSKEWIACVDAMLRQLRQS